MNEEISREALLIYLDNLRTLETIVHESIAKKERLEDYMCGLEIDTAVRPKNEPPSREKIEKAEANWRNEKDVTPTKGTMIFVIILGAFLFFLGLSSKVTLCVIIGVVLWVLAILIKRFRAWQITELEDLYKQECEAYEKAKKVKDAAYERELQAYNKSYKKFSEGKTTSKKLRDELTADEMKSKKLLEKAYSANIIPMQFRDIHGVYYLYDYLSTSNETLTSALMQYNLETIKQKLDRVIALQGKQIIMQAQANHRIYEQNQRILETAQATMNNTAVAAQYAKIAALNSEVSLKMQSQQLAYQKAEFWLK